MYVGSGRFFKREQDEGEIESEVKAKKKRRNKKECDGERVDGESNMNPRTNKEESSVPTAGLGGACASLGPPGKGSWRPLETWGEGGRSHFGGNDWALFGCYLLCYPGKRPEVPLHQQLAVRILGRLRCTSIQSP